MTPRPRGSDYPNDRPRLMKACVSRAVARPGLWAILSLVLSVQLTSQIPNLNASAVRPAMLRWQIGIGRQSPPQHVIETISSTTVGGRAAWRVAHYPVDPTEGIYDFYDIDASTLSPLRSVMKSRTFELSLMFDQGRVRLQRTEDGMTASESIAPDGRVMAEGPGDTVFIAGLPLKNGYVLNYQIVDRFRGREQTRIRPVTLSVVDRGRIATSLGMHDVLEVRSIAVDGSFDHVRQVRADAPHYPFRVEYTSGSTRLISEVTAMAFAPADSAKP